LTTATNKPPKWIVWVKAARLRTLPLALSSVIMGSFLAIDAGHTKPWVIGLALLTTLFLQILSNFANDYGDSAKGTDNEHRLGPMRTVQSGEISHSEMRRGIAVMVVLSLISGVLLIYVALGTQWIKGLLFLALGIAAIVAAIKYVVGKSAYGYRGLGDIFVFLFFGLAGVSGTYYLNTLDLPSDIWLPAAALGFFSTGVLNLNNMRDAENDRRSGKITIPVRLGPIYAKIYHVLLIAMGWTCAFLFNYVNQLDITQWMYAVVLPLFVVDLVKILRTENLQALDPFLKKLALTTLTFTILFGISLTAF